MVVVSSTITKQLHHLLSTDMRTSASLLFGLLAATLVICASATPLEFVDNVLVQRPETVYRLPTAVKPYHYDISLVPDLTEGVFTFSGENAIYLTVSNLTNMIIVHSDRLNISESATTLTFLENNSLINIATQTYDELRHFYLLSFSDHLPLGNYLLTFSFTGYLATDMYGFYRSSYQVGTETRWLATTQFQATSARRAFPCFDEPGMKASFGVRLGHFQNQVALSNMPYASVSAPDESIGGRVWTQFQTTPVMSTYLLAFIVSEFDHVGSADDFYAIWSRSEAIGTAEWALEATQVLYPTFLNNILVPDPWPKVHQVAIPDFSAGAMENWGLITYRERLLLWQDGESNLRTREQIATIISHELAHIWFGNLVSPVWWDHLWFNEGFASFYELYIPALAYPEYRYAERRVTDQLLPMLISDSLETTRAMTNVVGGPASVSASFDNVAYSKGAAVFRMLQLVMTEQLFAIAMRDYLTAAAHGTFDPEVLWEHMQIVADANNAVQNHMPIADIMNSWVTQPGFPLVTVWRNYSTTVVAFNQERFFMNPDSPTADPESQRWWIPITYTAGTNPGACNNVFMQPDWLRAQDKAIMGNGIANTTWILANCQGTGVFRTNYDPQNWGMLTEFLKGPDFEIINTINRAILIDDSFNLARAGYIDYSIPLDLSGYLAQETDFVVWRAAIPVFNYLNFILQSDAYYPYWLEHQRNLVSHIYQSLGWDALATDSHTIRLHRQQILNLACIIDLEDARAIAQTRFNLWIENPTLNPIDPDLRSVVYCWGVRSASQATWNIMWNRFLATDLATEEDLLLRGLACVADPAIVNGYLQLSVNPNSGIRSQDAYTVVTSFLTNWEDNVDLIMDFLIGNTQAITDFYGGFNVISNMLVGISNRITTADQLERFRVVANSEQLGASDTVIQSGIQSASTNLEWISLKTSAIQAWLEDEGVAPATTPVIESEVDATTEEGNSATSFTSSLFFIFTSAMICLFNY